MACAPEEDAIYGCNERVQRGGAAQGGGHLHRTEQVEAAWILLLLMEAEVSKAERGITRANRWSGFLECMSMPKGMDARQGNVSTS